MIRPVPTLRVLLLPLLALLPASTAGALAIDFDSITSSASFSSLGISSSFAGYSWSVGWGSNHVSQPIGLAFGVGLGTSGDTSARNVSGEQSLFVDFGELLSVQGGFFRPLDAGLPPASTIQLRGFADGVLVGETAPVSLVGVWQFIAADLGPIDRLEIRSNAPGTYFGVDDLLVAAEPTTALAVVGCLGLLGMAGGRPARAGLRDRQRSLSRP